MVVIDFGEKVFRDANLETMVVMVGVSRNH